MDKKSKIGYVYKATDKVTGKIYIGATTKSLESRIQDHIDKAKRAVGYIFQNAIATYGKEAFDWEQIDTASSIDELAEKEKRYISEYNSKLNGYNIDEGGGFKKSVYKYDINGKLIAKFECLDEAAETVNSTKQHISRACLNVNHLYKGFYWSYQLKEPFLPIDDKRRKKVFQFDVNGNFINSFNSIATASSVTKINRTSIAKVCRNERNTAGGFLWKYD